EQVLLELGSIDEMTDRYRDTKQYLIGPEIFPSYVSVLKIVFIAVSIAISILFVIDVMLTPSQFVHHIGENLISLFFIYIQGFAWVTIIFALIDRFGTHNSQLHLHGKPWHPKQLQPLPSHRMMIKRSEPISSIILNVLLAILFVYSMELIGVHRFTDNGWSVIPIFKPSEFARFLPVILILIALNILIDSVKLVRAKWTIPLITTEAILLIPQLAAAAWIFADQSVWNPAFITQLVESGIMQAGSEAYDWTSTLWVAIQDNVLYLIGLVVIIQLI